MGWDVFLSLVLFAASHREKCNYFCSKKQLYGRFSSLLHCTTLKSETFQTIVVPLRPKTYKLATSLRLCASILPNIFGLRYTDIDHSAFLLLGLLPLSFWEIRKEALVARNFKVATVFRTTVREFPSKSFRT